MKNKKNKNEVIVDLLERKDWIVNEKNDCLWDTTNEQWMHLMKLWLLIAVYMILEKITSSLSKEKWWGNLICVVLDISFICLTTFLICKTFWGVSYKRSKIPHLINQLNRTDLKWLN